ncbi:unnamed protein product [Trifolium pratense]|uniref:Uncharacterized protein n=1 Tax=Trifolium pratense TaxID=57577 RepID=A0ACB0MAQ9_TRIPR|nr:unnamed protein product [Trifolium pratense]
MDSSLASSFFQFLSKILLLLTFPSMLSPTFSTTEFSIIKEATVQDLQLAFQTNQLTSRQLVEFYLNQIKIQNPILKGVLEVNPDALAHADRADYERREEKNHQVLFQGCMEFPFWGVGAIILGKATLSEWSHYRTFEAPSGWSARGGQGKNPYTLDEPCGSSSGSAISVAANLVSVSLGTETDGSILCPSSMNSVVGIKPTVGLTSRAGVVPISPRQDTVGPICRTVSDAAYVLEAIAGIDTYDNATIEASKYIPKGGYAQFLKKDGLRGKRLGVVRRYYDFGNDTFLHETFKLHLKTLRQKGAAVVDDLKIDNIDEIINGQSEAIALNFEFKLSLNAYLKDLITSPVKSLADVIAFNNKHPELEKMEYGQDVMVEAEKTDGIGEAQTQALLNLTRWSQDGFEKLMKMNKLDAVVTPFSSFSNILAIGGYPGVSVPAGYDEKGMPFGICFGGLKGSEPKLIEIAYSFEQATLIRKPPKVGMYLK